MAKLLDALRTLFLAATPAAILLALIAYPGFQGARYAANRRACYAEQKVLACALELYNLDNPGEDPRLERLDPAIVRQLRELGCLEPDCDGPCSAAKTFSYVVVPGRNDTPGRVGCVRHGFIQVPGSGGFDGNVRREFQRMGCTDAAVLDRCPTSRPREGQRRFLYALGVLGVFWLFVAMAPGRRP